MSFRAGGGGNGSRRYGHVPPVQYPVAGQQSAQQDIGRRPSFNSGDDGAYYGQGQDHAPSFQNVPSPVEDELFLTSPDTTSPPTARHGYGSAAAVALGYQQQYQYQDNLANAPQYQDSQQPYSSATTAQRTQSTTLPYHPRPSSRYSPASPHTQSPPSNFTPQAYNPAAYASVTSPQRQAPYHGYSNQDQGYLARTPSHGSAYGQSPGATSTQQFSQHAPSPALLTTYEQNSPGAPSHGQVPVYDPSSYSNTPYSSQNSNGGSPAPASFNGSQAPYPSTSQIPTGPQYSLNDQNSHYSRSSRSDSVTSPTTSPPVHQRVSPGLRRHPTNAPLPSRPVENGPSWDNYGMPPATDSQARLDSIMQDIQAELGSAVQDSRQAALNGQYDANEPTDHLQRYDSNATTLAHSASHSSNHAYDQPARYDEVDDDDDPEGTAGVLAMQQAELEDRRFSGSTFMYSDTPAASNPLPPYPEEQSHSSDSDIGGGGNIVDLGMLSGGYAGNLTYGNDVGSPPRASSSRGAVSMPPGNYYDSASAHYNLAAAPAFDHAEVDYGGTGGLQPPSSHRLSFDEGEERVSIHSRQSGTESPTKDDYQELFYHPGIQNRPLPPVPLGAGSDSSSMLSVNTGSRRHGQHTYSTSVDSRLYPAETPDDYYRTGSPYSPQPERSISLSGHSNTPQVVAPARSRTDAAEERRKIARQQQLTQQTPSGEYEPSASSSGGAFDSITLPSGRKRKFVPAKLTAADFRRCQEPWALSGIETWIRDMAEGEPDLREKIVEEGLINLFTFKVPTMNVADAELLSSHVVALMLESGLLLPDEEWVKFGDGHISGVLWQLTGLGCYAPRLHEDEISGRCYSYHCTRTLKKLDLEDSEQTKAAFDWHVFYGLKKEDWESKPKKEVERQNILHEIVLGEESYIHQLNVFRKVYRDELRKTNPPILHPDRRDKFLEAVFGKVEPVLRVNKDHLLSQLKYRQQEQGPWITGFSDLFREWIRKAKADYTEYAVGYPRATYMVRKEAENNILFKRFLDETLKNKASDRKDWTHFLFLPLQRLQRYSLLLDNVYEVMLTDSEEKTNLYKAIQEVKLVTAECDAKVEETNKRVQMMELNKTLVLRPGFQSVLNLDHLGRELIMEGDIQRMGSKGVRWVDTHALLFDHYLILAKAVISKDGRGAKKYDVSKEPIPMPLLFLESMNDEPVQRQKGITAPLGRPSAAQPVGSQLKQVASNGSGRPGLEHTATGSSIASSTHGGTVTDESRILYPFRLKHLGHEVYTLYASTARDRLDWCTKIIETKTRHARALFSQNAEPFRLRVLADAAFSYDSSSLYARSTGVPVKGTPLDRAIEEVEQVLSSPSGIAPVCRAQVNCAVGFTAFGKSVIAIGTDYGLFITDPSNPRGWTRSVTATRITQIAVLEEFSICLVIADKNLVSYPLDVVAPISEYAPPVNDSPRRAPVRLQKDVTYFATGKMKDRTLVFYKRKEGLHTSFKVLEPIMNRPGDKRNRLFGGRRGGNGGATESFRDFDEFFFPTECYSLSLFQSYIAVATAKGLEMLTLDRKQPMSIPDVRMPAIANIASRIRDQRPLGMFRLNENEFILTYEDCAVYVDKHGDVSRTLIMEYTGKQKKARGATMYGQYLLLFNEDYVEVRNADNGRLRQIVAGRDVRVLDYGVRGPTGGLAALSQQVPVQNGGSRSSDDTFKGTVKIAMSHPELQGRQIILELLLNDGHMEN